MSNENEQFTSGNWNEAANGTQPEVAFDNGNTGGNMDSGNTPSNNASGFSVASMVLGIVSISLSVVCCCCLSWFFYLIVAAAGITGLVLGIVALKNGKNGKALTGVILSSIAIFISIVIIIFIAGSVGFMKEFYQEYLKWLQENYPDIFEQYQSEFGSGLLGTIKGIFTRK